MGNTPPPQKNWLHPAGPGLSRGTYRSLRLPCSIRDAGCPGRTQGPCSQARCLQLPWVPSDHSSWEGSCSLGSPRPPMWGGGAGSGQRGRRMQTPTRLVITARLGPSHTKPEPCGEQRKQKRPSAGTGVCSGPTPSGVDVGNWDLESPWPPSPACLAPCALGD